MRLKGHGTKILTAIAVGIAVCVAGGASPASANCPGGSPIGWSFGPSYGGGMWYGCGANPEAYWWAHKLGVQRMVTSVTSNQLNQYPGGTDSGLLGGANMLYDYSYYFGPGAWYLFDPINGASLDWGMIGADGCLASSDLLETDTASCTGGSTYRATDFIIAGQDFGDPFLTVSGVVSADMNETSASHDFASCGAPAVDGDACNIYGDGGSYSDTNITCGVIPKPLITGNLGCTTAGCTLNIGLPAHTPPPVVDDCEVANSLEVNCPRDLGGDYVLMYRHGSCTVEPDPGDLDLTKTFLFPAEQTTVHQQATLNWCPLSKEDLNLNCVLDAGEDGANGGTANGKLDQYIFAGGGGASNQGVLVPKIAGGGCIHLGTAFRVDPNAILYVTIQHEPVLSPRVSMNVYPISLDTATPVADRVVNIQASKATGKASVSWETTAEFTTAGFNLVGVRKSGGEVRLNSALIPAEKGTTGESASYSVNLGARDLKGSTAVYVELVKISGATERFGPVSF